MNSKQIKQIFTAAAIFLAAALFARTYTTPEEVIQNTFHDVTEKITYTSELFINNNESTAGSSEDFEYFKVTEGDELLGFYREGKAKSKLKEFTYLLILDKEGKVLELEILSYNEVRGKEIRRRNFLNKFKHLSILNLKNKDIETITGATISSKALIKAVQTDLEKFAKITNP